MRIIWCKKLLICATLSLLFAFMWGGKAYATTCTANSQCDDGVACTVDSCDAGTCVNTPEDAFCGDGILCTDDICDQALGCTNPPVSCPQGEQCDPGTGQCMQCLVDADCDDGVGCTVDSCDAGTGACVNTPEDAVCGDGILCTDDICDQALGCTNAPVSCPQGEQCDPGTGQCVTSSECIVDADCDDGLFCNGDETCVAGNCQAGTLPCDLATQVCNEDSDICEAIAWSPTVLDVDLHRGIFVINMRTHSSQSSLLKFNVE